MHPCRRRAIATQVVLLAYLQLCTWLPLGAWNAQYGFELPDALYPIMGAIELAFVIGFVRGVRWLMWTGIAGHVLWLALQLESWWIPYATGFDPGRRAFYLRHFGDTIKFLPTRGDHLAPDAMHVVLTALIVAVLVTGIGALRLPRHRLAVSSA